MFKELWEIFKEFMYRLVHSRLFPVTVLFTVMFLVLIVRLFQLQILESDEHQSDYIQMTLSTVTTEAVRGNIYDRNGVLLAYDKLVYSVTLKDTGYYEKNAEKNQMIWELVLLLDSCGEDVDVSIPIGLSDDSKTVYCYTTTSETRIKQFLRDVYGCTLSELDQEDGKYPSDISADEAVELMKEKYYFDKWEDDDGKPVVPDASDTLKIVDIRYRLSQNLYKKYISITIASDVDSTTMATVLEYSADLQGVDVEEDYIRVYPDGEYFAHIIGYTGLANSDELAQLQEVDPTYESGDTIGKSGIESLMEQELSGTKGERTMYLDSTGKVLEVISEDEAIVGNDVYLTIDHDLTIACYKLLEQQMSNIILTYLTEDDKESSESSSEGIPITIKDVYFHLFDNNVISISELYDTDAPEWEQAIASQITSLLDEVILEVSAQLYDSPDVLSELDENMQDYMDYIIEYLCSSSYINGDALDKTDGSYEAVTNKEISLQEFIYDLISQNDVVDLSALNVQDDYYDSEDIYRIITQAILDDLSADEEFTKILIEHLLDDGKITAWHICKTLYSQGVLEANSVKEEALTGASDHECYRFIYECISKQMLTPAQLALDPCNGSVVVTDVNSGEVLALVSYPGYDNNMFSGSVDAQYYSSLLADNSNPLFNYATQARSAPGSTFKMLTSIACLEEGIIDKSTQIECTGIFDLVSPAAKCWIYREQGTVHGSLNVVDALAQSCNYFFYSCGYQLSIDEDGTYNEALGIEKLARYAALLGLNEKSQIELSEYSPQVSSDYPVVSAIGQGTNNYTPIQLARYVTAIASGGTLYDMTLLSKVVDHDGNVVDECQNDSGHIDEISDETWDIVKEGMYEVTHSGTVSGYFNNVDFDISGKTGSAQEDLTRPNHALFVSFGPSDDPQITVTTTIRNGYSSGYTAILTREIYKYYFGETALEDIDNVRVTQTDASGTGD